MRKPLAGVAVALLAGATAAGCSAATPPRQSAPPTPAVAPAPAQILAAQPFPGAAGAGDHLLVEAHGTGPRALASFVVRGSLLYFEIACSGPGSFTVAARTPLFVVGPCNGSGIISTIGGEKGRRLALTAEVAPSTRWELYLTES
jgi:hypothetical protein